MPTFDTWKFLIQPYYGHILVGLYFKDLIMALFPLDDVYYYYYYYCSFESVLWD